MDVCSPFQYALSTRAGAEALARALSVSCELNPSNTVVCVDGVGAYDHIARAAMFEGLRRGARLASLMPFVRQVYGRESTYIFYDNRTRATSLPGAGLPCSQQHAMLQTSPALPQQPMPTMMTLRASDAGRPPARTSAEEKCPEAGPCSQRRLWLRALKTPSQHCLTRPGAHLPSSPKSLQTCATSNLTRRPHSQMPPSVRLCVPRGGGPLPAYQARRASTTKFCSTMLKPSSCSRMLRTCSPQRKIPANIAAALAVSRLTALPCVSLPAGCGGSLPPTRSAGSCRDVWHANMPTRLTRPPALTNSPFRRVPALMLCLASCVLQSTLMPTPRSSH